MNINPPREALLGCCLLKKRARGVMRPARAGAWSAISTVQIGSREWQVCSSQICTAQKARRHSLVQQRREQVATEQRNRELEEAVAIRSSAISAIDRKSTR